MDVMEVIVVFNEDCSTSAFCRETTTMTRDGIIFTRMFVISRCQSHQPVGCLDPFQKVALTGEKVAACKMVVRQSDDFIASRQAAGAYECWLGFGAVVAALLMVRRLCWSRRGARVGSPSSGTKVCMDDNENHGGLLGGTPRRTGALEEDQHQTDEESARAPPMTASTPATGR